MKDQYRIADVVGRIKLSGTMPLELVGDYTWNTELDENNRGLWIAAVLGSLTTSRARGEYTYSTIDRDAVVAATTRTTSSGARAGRDTAWSSARASATA